MLLLGGVSFILAHPSLQLFACYHLEPMYREEGRKRKRDRCQMPGPALTPKTLTVPINQKKSVGQLQGRVMPIPSYEGPSDAGAAARISSGPTKVSQ